MATPHDKYLSWAHRTVGFAGQDVLEIGGCSPVQELLRYSPRSWVCVNLDPVSVETFNHDAEQHRCRHFSAVVQDAAKIEPTPRFSVVYSINAFEHIQDLRTTLAKIAQVLIPGGVLFTVFGPIWSSDIGHHLSIPTESGSIGIFDGVLRPWEHLTSTAAEIRARLDPELGPKVSNQVVDYVFTYPDINRLCESDYIRILRASGLSPVLIIRRKTTQRAPAIAEAGRTREFLWLLKKGAPTVLDRTRAAARFAFAFVHTRLAQRH